MLEIKETEYLECEAETEIYKLWQSNEKYHITLSPSICKLNISQNAYLRYISRLISVSYKVNFIVAYDNKKIVGYLIATIREDNKSDNYYGVISDIYVKRSYRLKGIGKTMMKKAIQWINYYSKYIELSVVKGNTNALIFYEKCGFNVVSHNMVYEEI
jgi:ribosomal protein S18 acetylase RimI-like enzyme